MSWIKFMIGTTGPFLHDTAFGSNPFRYEGYQGQWGGGTPRGTSSGRTSGTTAERGGRASSGSGDRESSSSPSRRESSGTVYVSEFSQYQNAHKWATHFAASAIAGL